MASEIATADRVRDAVATLRRRGAKPTADKVIVLIGGGSKTTVLEHMKHLRNQPAAEVDLPNAILELAKPMLSEVFAAGRAAEADLTKAATQRLGVLLEEQDEQVVELVAANETLAAANSALQLEADANAQTIGTLEEQLSMAGATIGHLRDALAEERRTASMGLKEALSRMEAMLQTRPVEPMTSETDTTARVGRRPSAALPKED